jgi:predicted N-acetyltransferase YhbS
MTEPKLSIRPFAPDDLSHIDEIRRLAFEPVFASFRAIVGPAIAKIAFATAEAEQSEHLTKLCDPETPEMVFVAECEGVIVGFVSVSLNSEQKIGEIGLNAVHPGRAGQGVGTALCEFALKEMRRAGMLVATVGTGGDDSHAPARRAYEKAGFGSAIPSLWMYRTL